MAPTAQERATQVGARPIKSSWDYPFLLPLIKQPYCSLSECLPCSKKKTVRTYVEIVWTDLSGTSNSKPRHCGYWYQSCDRHRNDFSRPVDRHHQDHVAASRRLHRQCTLNIHYLKDHQWAVVSGGASPPFHSLPSLVHFPPTLSPTLSLFPFPNTPFYPPFLNSLPGKGVRKFMWVCLCLPVL